MPKGSRWYAMRQALLMTEPWSVEERMEFDPPKTRGNWRRLVGRSIRKEQREAAKAAQDG